MNRAAWLSAAAGALVLSAAGKARSDELGQTSFQVAEQAALFASPGAATPRTSSIEVWANGLGSTPPRFAPEIGKSIGLRLPPGPMTGVAVGWELHRNATSSSDVTWAYGVKGRDLGLEALQWSMRAGGRIGVLARGMSQSIATDLSVALPEFTPAWTSRLQVSPELSFDAVQQAVTLGGGPEFVSETLLPSPSASLKSALNFSLGYRFSSETKPGVAASLAWTLTPAM